MEKSIFGPFTSRFTPWKRPRLKLTPWIDLLCFLGRFQDINFPVSRWPHMGDIGENEPNLEFPAARRVQLFPLVGVPLLGGGLSRYSWKVSFTLRLHLEKNDRHVDVSS